MRAVKQQYSQRGLVLTISLIILVLITILAMSGMRATIMEERMAGNSRNSNLAFQRAETALRAAEAALDDAVPAVKSKANGIANAIGIANCVVTLDSLDFHAASTWSSASACTYSAAGGLDANKHKYYIEFLFATSSLANPIAPCFYRVTARGFGDSQNSFSTLQSTYKFNGCSA